MLSEFCVLIYIQKQLSSNGVRIVFLKNLKIKFQFIFYSLQPYWSYHTHGNFFFRRHIFVWSYRKLLQVKDVSTYKRKFIHLKWRFVYSQSNCFIYFIIIFNHMLLNMVILALIGVERGAHHKLKDLKRFTLHVHVYFYDKGL